MRKSISIIVNNKLASGYTVKLYAYSTASPFYTGSALYTFTDNGDGSYYADITTTMKGTIVITTTGSTVVTVPAAYIGQIFQGDNQLTIQPGGTT